MENQEKDTLGLFGNEERHPEPEGELTGGA